MPRLSIIILSYNTKDLTKKCINSLIDSLKLTSNFFYEIIVIDNGSKDGSIKMLQNFIPIKSGSNFKLILNKKNLGYPKGNNQGLRESKGDYILFLNSDVTVDQVNFEKLINYLDSHPQVGALTVKVLLLNNLIDPASHRGFPTIWNSFCYFSRLEKLFKSIPIANAFFGGYHLCNLNLNIVHEIDSPSGAFYLVRSKIVKKLKGFDENFFMYGEDIDLSYRIKRLGFKILYYPNFMVTHFKHASGLGKRDGKTRSETKQHFYEAMRIFYKKHYESKHSGVINKIVFSAIDLLKYVYV